ncbi:hypothetical protein EMCRGX_G002821 [Ephydatia muelleri]
MEGEARDGRDGRGGAAADSTKRRQQTGGTSESHCNDGPFPQLVHLGIFDGQLQILFTVNLLTLRKPKKAIAKAACSMRRSWVECVLLTYRDWDNSFNILMDPHDCLSGVVEEVGGGA